MGVAHGARRAAGLIKHKAAAPAAVLSGAESVYSMLFVPRGMSAWRSRLSCAAVASARGLALPSARSEGVGAPFLHSFHKAFPGTPPKVHVRGSGVYVYDDEGNKLLDGLAGLWSVSLGYGQKRIVDAAARQMEQLPFFHTFWNQGHDKGYELAEALQAFIPWKVEKVAFTSGGSDANDTAVKMVWFYNNALGRVGKKKIIARNKGYHGVTSVAASCSGLPGLQANFGFSQQDLPLPGFIHVTCPHMYRFALPDEDEEAFAARLAQELETTILREGAHTVAAVIAEPLMGAGGVMPPPRGYFDKVRALTRKYDVLLIADEVVCGFGRLGPRFGCTAYGFEPDLMSMAKALTSSYAPMGAVAVSPSVAQVLAAGSDASLFGHGYTFGAHPVSCAVALECLRIFQEDNISSNVAARSQELLQGLEELARDSPIAGEVRGRGLIAAIELVADRHTRQPFPPSLGVGAFFCERARAHGVIVRAIGDTLACSPPLTISAGEVQQLLHGYSKALRDTEEMLHTKGEPLRTHGQLFTSSLQL